MNVISILFYIKGFFFHNLKQSEERRKDFLGLKCEMWEGQENKVLVQLIWMERGKIDGPVK